MAQLIQKSILISAPVSTVWEYLTVPDLMTQWMGDPEMDIEIISDWKVGSPFIVRGFHHDHFENHGKIIRLEINQLFQYSHLSSLSELPDQPENHTIITFGLAKSGETQTELAVTAANFPTEAIYKHWEFYWNGTMQLIKLKIEKGKAE